MKLLLPYLNLCTPHALGLYSGCHHDGSPVFEGVRDVTSSVVDIQDIVTRYATGTGHHCPRRFGWDCHGLPVEYEIDKKLGEVLCLTLHSIAHVTLQAASCQMTKNDTCMGSALL